MTPADTNPRRPGRPVLSRTGERRRPWNVAIAPAARARVEAEAARRGMSPSALIEEWALSEQIGRANVHAELTTAGLQAVTRFVEATWLERGQNCDLRALAAWEVVDELERWATRGGQ